MVLTFCAGCFCAAALGSELETPESHAMPIRLEGFKSRDGALAYSNVPPPDDGDLFRSSFNPWHALDDNTFSGGPAEGGDVTVIGAEFGFFVIGEGVASFDVFVRFFDTLDPESDPVNSDLLGAFRVTISDVEPGAYLTGLIDLKSFGGIYFPDNDFATNVFFFEPGTNEPSDRATPAFYGEGVAVGTSEDVYWRDVDGNNQYDSNEARFFGGYPNLANFAMQLTIPEPSAALALLAGACLLRRRG
jgi:hypothetical protein